MKVVSRILCSLACVLGIAGSVHAAINTSQLFSDNMILQRGAKAPIWGTSDKPEDVTIKFGDQTVTAKPADGRWMAELAPMEANATPRDLTITQGDQTITRKNVLVGDLWVCGGQSNMQWAVNQSAGKDEAISSAGNPLLRFFTVNRRGAPEPQKDLPDGGWVESSPNTVPGFTAVGYYFGRDLQAATKVPIGLVSSNIGGTTAERWMSKAAMDANPELAGMSGPQGKNDLYNAMIAPLSPLAVKGAIWYQGESNADRPYHYRHVLGTMIKSWRETFRNPEMPFYIVELAPFTPIVKDPIDQEWSTVRESMQFLAKNDKNVATVSIVDVGDEKDIHPQKKQPVGERLARLARKRVYGEAIIDQGPVFESLKIEGNKAIVKFANVGEGLVAKDGELTGFTVAGEDKKFANATAKIEGDSVVVTAEGVAVPVSVRFGWANYPVVNLFNKEGLPAHPFRTDDWEVVKQAAK